MDVAGVVAEAGVGPGKNEKGFKDSTPGVTDGVI